MKYRFCILNDISWSSRSQYLSQILQASVWTNLSRISIPLSFCQGSQPVTNGSLFEVHRKKVPDSTRPKGNPQSVMTKAHGMSFKLNLHVITFARNSSVKRRPGVHRLTWERGIVWQFSFSCRGKVQSEKNVYFVLFASARSSAQFRFSGAFGLWF